MGSGTSNPGGYFVIPLLFLPPFGLRLKHVKFDMDAAI